MNPHEIEIESNLEGNYESIIQNIVASADLGGVLDLNAVALGFGMENIEYEPEQFPGVGVTISNAAQ